MKKSLILLSILSILFSGCVIKNQSVESKKVDSTPVKVEKLNKKKKELETKKESKLEDKVIKEETKPKVIIKEKTKIVVVEKPVTSDSKIVAGSEEYVYIPSVDLTYKARIDTGATTTSIHAIDIKEFERDGKKWVKFKFQTPKGKLIDWSLPVEREVSIKRHGLKENQKRYVVKLRINLGKISELVDVSLTDRSKFSFKALIGRNFLNGFVVVDVSKKYVTKPKKK